MTDNKIYKPTKTFKITTSLSLKNQEVVGA